MQRSKSRSGWVLLAVVGLTLAFGPANAQQAERGQSSYMPVDITELFASIRARLAAAKPAVEREHNALLNERYDLSNRLAAGLTMDRVKPVQEGVRVKLPAGVTWESLAAMTPDQIRDQNLFPKGFYPLPHPKHQEGGFVFPHFVIDAIKQQDGRDLQRFDIDFDFPDWFLPEFPPANSGNLDGATSRPHGEFKTPPVMRRVSLPLAMSYSSTKPLPAPATSSCLAASCTA